VPYEEKSGALGFGSMQQLPELEIGYSGMTDPPLPWDDRCHFLK